MVASINIHDLLDDLRSMLSRVSRLILEQRLNHHKTKSVNVRDDISEQLLTHIDRLNTASRKDSVITASQAGATTGGVTSAPYLSSRADSKSKVGKWIKSTTQVKHGLSAHLRNCRSRNENETYIGQRLKRSVWEHLHNAFYNAREGDESLAKLHTDIAMQAMKEAHKYLDYEEFVSLSDKVKVLISS